MLSALIFLSKGQPQKPIPTAVVPQDLNDYQASYPTKEEIIPQIYRGGPRQFRRRHGVLDGIRIPFAAPHFVWRHRRGAAEGQFWSLSVPAVPYFAAAKPGNLAALGKAPR